MYPNCLEEEKAEGTIKICHFYNKNRCIKIQTAFIKHNVNPFVKRLKNTAIFNRVAYTDRLSLCLDTHLLM